MGGKYTPDSAGLREIGRSHDMQAACLAVAQQIANRANSDDPEGHYVAAPRDVAAGRNNEVRAGAHAIQTTDSRRGVERRSLTRAVR